jgi:hypothetical protein
VEPLVTSFSEVVFAYSSAAGTAVLCARVGVDARDQRGRDRGAAVDAPAGGAVGLVDRDAGGRVGDSRHVGDGALRAPLSFCQVGLGS